MARSKFGSFQNLFNQSDRFSRINSLTDTLIKLDIGIKTIIGKPLADHIQISCIRRNYLIYTVDQQIWAHGLRMNKAKILSIIQQLTNSPEKYAHKFNTKDFKQLQQINELIIQVKPSMQPRASHSQARQARKISQDNAKMLIETADSFNDDELKQKWIAFVQKNTRKEL